jgi:hypothetical protein
MIELPILFEDTGSETIQASIVPKAGTKTRQNKK